MNESEMSPGVYDLALALRRVQLQFGLATVLGAYRLPDDHMLSLRWMALDLHGDVIEIERDDGYVQLITEPPAGLLEPPPLTNVPAPGTVPALPQGIFTSEKGE